MIDDYRYAGTRELLADRREGPADQGLVFFDGHDHDDFRQVHASLEPRALNRSWIAWQFWFSNETTNA